MPTNNKKFRSKSRAPRNNSRRPNARRSRRNNNNGQPGYGLIKRNPSAMNKNGCFRTQCMFSSAVSIASLTTVLRVDIIPTLSLFRI